MRCKKETVAPEMADGGFDSVAETGFENSSGWDGGDSAAANTSEWTGGNTGTDAGEWGGGNTGSNW